jgi:hypothetical protein
MFGKFFWKKKPLTDIRDLAAFFVELVSRSKNYLHGPVRVHFVTDCVPGKNYCVCEAGNFLPFLRTVLFDAAQNTVPNPEVSLCMHTTAESSAGKIAAVIASEIRQAKHESFIISLEQKSARKNALFKEFAALPEETRKRITLFSLLLQKSGSREETDILVSAVKILLTGGRIQAGRTGLRVLQEKI